MRYKGGWALPRAEDYSGYDIHSEYFIKAMDKYKSERGIPLFRKLTAEQREEFKKIYKAV